MSDIFSELIESEKEIKLNDVLINLIDGSKDIDLKTEIKKPKQMTSLKILADFLGKLKYTNCESILKEFLTTYFRYMFSFNRQSRKEVIQGISAQLEAKQKNMMNKLTEKIP